MRILITGANGFIGSHLTESLNKRGHQLRCLVRNTSDLTWIKNLPIEYIYGDLFDEDAMKKAVKDVECIYHLAGVTKSKTKAGYYRGNHLATKNLLEITLATNPSLKRFVHVSSQAAVGPSLEGKPIDEQTPFHPITTYGLSKMEAEKECLKMMDRLPLTIVRPPAVYGPRDKDVFEFFHVISKGLHPLIGFSDKYVSLIHVKDLVDGILSAGENPKALGQTYFISSEGYYNWKQLGEITSKIMGKKVIRVKIPAACVYTVAAFAQFFSVFSSKPAVLNIEKGKDIVQNAWTCDIAKARKELGFKETMTIEEGIKNTVDWYRQKGWIKG